MATLDKEYNVLIFDDITDFINTISKLEHRGSLYQYLVCVRDDTDEDDFSDLTIALTHAEMKMLEELLNA